MPESYLFETTLRHLAVRGRYPDLVADRCRDENDALELARRISLKSPCQSKRGAVIWATVSRNWIQVGYNHQAIGFGCDGSDRCKRTCGRTAIHAEESAILYSPRDTLIGASMLHVKTVDGKPVPSGEPSCIRCSGMIVESGIDFMWLLREDGLRRYTATEFHFRTIEALLRRELREGN